MVDGFRFEFDENESPQAYAEDDEHDGLFTWFLMSDLQTPYSCADILSVIQAIEEGALPEYAGIGNLMLLTLTRERATVQVGIPITKKPPDYGEANEMPLAALKQLVKAWQQHLASAPVKRKKKQRK